MTKLKQYKMFIDGEWVDSDTKKTFETLNPEKQIYYFPEILSEAYSSKGPNNYNLLQRTELIEHLNFSKNKNSIVVTHVNAIAQCIPLISFFLQFNNKLVIFISLLNLQPIHRKLWQVEHLVPGLLIAHRNTNFVPTCS